MKILIAVSFFEKIIYISWWFVFLKTGVEMEIIDEISLVEWLVNNFKSFGN